MGTAAHEIGKTVRDLMVIAEAEHLALVHYLLGCVLVETDLIESQAAKSESVRPDCDFH